MCYLVMSQRAYRCCSTPVPMLTVFTCPDVGCLIINYLTPREVCALLQLCRTVQAAWRVVTPATRKPQRWSVDPPFTHAASQDPGSDRLLLSLGTDFGVSGATTRLYTRLRVRAAKPGGAPVLAMDVLNLGIASMRVTALANCDARIFFWEGLGNTFHRPVSLDLTTSWMPQLSSAETETIPPRRVLTRRLRITTQHTDCTGTVRNEVKSIAL